MNVGILVAKLHFPQSQSLKSKRRILKSLLDRLQTRFKVSVCELEQQDTWQLATIAVAIISSDKKQVQTILSKMLDFIVTSANEYQLLDHQQEIIAA